MASLNKLKAEAGLTEQKMILGWHLDFRRLIISLPPNKYIAWSTSIGALITKKVTTAKELEST